MKLGLITYDLGHRKTQEVFFRLQAKNRYEFVFILAPFTPYKPRKTLFSHRPFQFEGPDAQTLPSVYDIATRAIAAKASYRGLDMCLMLCANRLLRLLGTENGALLSPLFYQDNEHTFFVEPALVNVPFDLYGGFGLVGVTLKGA